MSRILGTLIVLALLSAGCTDPAPACDTLAERLCAASNEAFCEVLKTKAKDQLNDSAKQEECQAVLEDAGKLREVLDGVKAATRFELKAEKPEAAKKATKATKARKTTKATKATSKDAPAPTAKSPSGKPAQPAALPGNRAPAASPAPSVVK
jgi:hypothetical protein